MRRLALTLVLVGASSVLAQEASAQVQRNRFSVTTRLGAVQPERASSINTGGVVGLDTEFAFSNYFALGGAFDVARSNTHGEDFVARLRYGNGGIGGGDTVFYQYTSQPVSTINAGLYASGRFPVGRITPFVMGGAGVYTQLLDIQVTGRAARNTDVSYTAGAGLTLRLSERTGVQLDVRSIMLQKFDRTFLDPTSGRSPNTVFPEDFPSIPTAKNTAQNTVFTLGFRYIPGTGN